jgi:hypothetical protein
MAWLPRIPVPHLQSADLIDCGLFVADYLNNWIDTGGKMATIFVQAPKRGRKMASAMLGCV